MAKDLIKRAIRVESAAKKNISKTPKRVDTGRLRASITWEMRTINGVPTVRVGTNVKYARFVHDGTGLYGPKHAYIYPKAKKFMRWKKKGTKGYIYAKRIKGMKPNPFLTNALKAAKL